MFTFTNKLCLSYLGILIFPIICQANCYDTPTPSNSSSQFIVDNDHGTVTDTRTRLMWQKCAYGQTGSGCTGTPLAFTWQGALNKAQSINLDGSLIYDNWRLPNLKELISIVEFSCNQPAIDSNIFPNTGYAPIYWSSTPSFNTNEGALKVFFENGEFGLGVKSTELQIRLVRDLPPTL